ncbi:hypothetical protein DFJ77DRAFT_451991 [Powellomyces hirtus]|nr:hypothetical protein DFJ77DRAFT_451991 [Powellomyces hirtus]
MLTSNTPPHSLVIVQWYTWRRHAGKKVLEGRATFLSLYPGQAMEYWTVSEGKAIKTQTCRECRGTIHKDEDVKVRDGRKIRLFYHPTCFSGSADPRTQARSSFHDPRYASAHLSTAAPPVKGHGKWSVEQYGYSPAVGFGTPAKVANAADEGKGRSRVGSRVNLGSK